MARTKEASDFYKTKARQKCRDAFARSKGGLCERCLKRGLYVPGEIVHHKIYLDEATVHDPEILLSWSNLELLCRKCHGEEHDSRKRRYTIDEFGKIVTR